MRPSHGDRNSFRPAALALAGLIAVMPDLSAAAPVLLTSGTAVRMELEHHVTSAYTPVGGLIQLRIAEDVRIGDAVVISKGTPVAAKMRQAADRAMMGTSGSMTIGVDFVTAADGQQLRVVATETRQGRDRGNALAGWTIFWGLPGLMTRGAHPYLLRGSQLEAQVLFDRRIEAAGPGDETPPVLPAASSGTAIERHRFTRPRGDPYKLDMERDTDLGQLEFFVTLPAEAAAAADDWSLALVAVDDLPLVEAVPGLMAASGIATFDSWAILKYCRDGTTALRFRIGTPAGQAIETVYPMNVKYPGRK